MIYVQCFILDRVTRQEGRAIGKAAIWKRPDPLDVRPLTGLSCLIGPRDLLQRIRWITVLLAFWRIRNLSVWPIGDWVHARTRQNAASIRSDGWRIPGPALARETCASFDNQFGHS